MNELTDLDRRQGHRVATIIELLEQGMAEGEDSFQAAIERDMEALLLSEERKDKIRLEHIKKSLDFFLNA